MKRILGLAVLSSVLTAAFAADIEAGRAKVQQVCAACHGVNGVSVGDAIPNLAGQKAAYIETQLKALLDEWRWLRAGGSVAYLCGNPEMTRACAEVLGAAGFAPTYQERSLDDPDFRLARQSIDRLLSMHEPNPALAVDRHAGPRLPYRQGC